MGWNTRQTSFRNLNVLAKNTISACQTNSVLLGHMLWSEQKQVCDCLSPLCHYPSCLHLRSVIDFLFLAIHRWNVISFIKSSRELRKKSHRFLCHHSGAQSLLKQRKKSMLPYRWHSITSSIFSSFWIDIVQIWRIPQVATALTGWKLSGSRFEKNTLDQCLLTTHFTLKNSWKYTIRRPMGHERRINPINGHKMIRSNHVLPIKIANLKWQENGPDKIMQEGNYSWRVHQLQ